MSSCLFVKSTFGLLTTVLPALLLASTALAQEHGGQGSHGAGQPEAVDELVVTAEKIDEYIGQHPGQVVVLGVAEIEEHNILSVEEALNNMAGVDVQKSFGTGSRISIRGSSKGGSTILILLNGRPLNSNQYGGVELSSIPIDIVESVTVFKPPVPVWLGPGGSDGAISIVTRDSMKESGEKKKFITKLRTAVGSYGRIEGSASERIQTEKGGAMIAAQGMHKDGKRVNSDADSGSVTVNWDRELGENGPKVEIGARYYGAEYGSSGPEDNPTPDARQSYEKASLDGKIKGFVGEGGDYSLSLYGDYIDLEDNSQSGFTSTLENTKLGMKGENSWLGEVWNLRLNAILEREDVDHTLSGEHHRVTSGMGAQTDRIWDDLIVTLGLRGDNTTDFDFNPGMSSGLNYEITDQLSFKVGAGYSVNIPTFGQLYQPSHGTIDQARGNPDLDKEKIWSYDTALQYKLDKGRQFQVSLFRSDTNDPIVYGRGDDFIYRPFNSDEAWRQGIELTAKYATAIGITFDGDLLFQDSEIEETGNQLNYTPHVKAKLTAFYVLENPGTKLETTVRYRSKQYTEATNNEDMSIDGYVTTDLKITQPFNIKMVAMEWFVNVQNLFDVDYQVHYGYPDDGIRFLTGINVTL
jgi:vitamin B12 transporter